MIELPIVYIKYNDIVEYMKKLLEYKNIYNKIKDNNAEREVPTECLDELFNALYIDDFQQPYLHTLILMEDATTQKIVKDTSSYLNHMMTTCAHIQCSFFVLIHYWKALTPNLKSNIYTAYVYPGYSRQQITYILYQMNLPDDLRSLCSTYVKLDVNKYQKMIVDCIEMTYKII